MILKHPTRCDRNTATHQISTQYDLANRMDVKSLRRIPATTAMLKVGRVRDHRDIGHVVADRYS